MEREELDYSVLLPQEEYSSWVPYEVMDTLYEKFGWSNPYRNPDRTLDSLIFEEARSN